MKNTITLSPCNLQKSRNLIRVLLLVVVFLVFTENRGSGQGVSALERARMENYLLRQRADSLERALAAYKQDIVFNPWDVLTGISADRDNEYEYDYDSGFGLQGVRIESEYHKKVLATLPSFSVKWNDVFDRYIDLYTVTRRKSMPYILGRYNKYSGLFKSSFSKYGVPEELTLLSVVESAVSRRALSKAGALGIWQLMPETARHYGLLVDGTVDERLDIAKSTDVAARMLRDLKKSLGTWELAVLAYNCGAGNVRKAIIRAGGARDLWSIYEFLPAETRAYLPLLVGARFCEAYAQEYNIVPRKIVPDPAGDKYAVSKDLHILEIAEVTGANPELLLEINCQYLRGVVPSGMVLTIPRGSGEILKQKSY